MPDGLNADERALAWAASWNTSFDGIAIVNKDFTFRNVNDQFASICGVTKAELIGHTFTDITPEPIRSLDVKNANLVMAGVVSSYIIQKTYRFEGYNQGKIVPVTMLVRGVYHPESKEFLFFISRIMKDESAMNAEFTTSPLPKQTLLSYAAENKKTVASIIASAIVIAALKAAAFIEATVTAVFTKGG